MMTARYSIFGSYLMDIRELQQVQPSLFWSLQKPQRDSYNLSVISGLRIGPNVITASALDKVKVKK